MKYLNFFLLLSLSIFACTQSAENKETKEAPNTKAVEYKELGSEMCKCLEPSLALYKEQVELAEKNDLEGIKTLKGKQKEVIETANICLMNLESKYPSVAGIEEEKMVKVMEENCPEIAAYWKQL